MTVTQRTVFPTAVEAYQRLASVLSSAGVLTLTAEDGQHASIPDDLKAALVDAVATLGAGEAVSVLPRPTLLTTQEAADLLSVSRPTLIKLLEGGEIPFEKRGRHRRVRLQDVLLFKELRGGRRRAGLESMARDADEYRTAAGDRFVQTR